MIESVVSSSQMRAPLKDEARCGEVSREESGPEARLPEVSLFEVLTQLACRKWLIAKATAISMLLGGAACLVLPVHYTATTRIMPPQQTQSSASLMMNQLANMGAGSLAAVAGGGFGMKNPNDIYIGLLNSRPIADAIIRRFGLQTVYRAKDMTAARKRLANATVVVSEKKGFIAVSVTDKDRVRGAGMANAYTEELRVLTKTLAVSEASQRRLFYEEQLTQAKESLLAAEASFAQVQQTKGLVQLDAQAKAMIESLALLRAQIAAREVEVESLRSYSTEHNPQLELAERDLGSLRAEAARMEQRNHSSRFADLGLRDVPDAGLDYLRAEHEVKYRQAMFDLLLKQYDAAKLDESKDAAIIQVVEPAIEPDRRSSMAPAVRMLCFIVGGLVAGCLIALTSWWKERVQSNPHSAQQLRALKNAFLGATVEDS